MGSIDYGTQIKSVGFFDPADSIVVNRRGLNVQERGIYAGGYLTKSSDVAISISPLVCIIGDATSQLRVETTVSCVISGVSLTNRFIVLRWTYTGATSTDYMDILAVPVGSIQANDLIVGVANYAGASMTVPSYDFAGYPRSEPKVLSLTGKVEAEQTPSLYARVRATFANYGSASYAIYNQKVGPFDTAVAAAYSRIDIVYINSTGVVSIAKGTEAATPVPPTYASRIVLAEVTFNPGDTTVVSSRIRDTRAFLSGTPSTVDAATIVNLPGLTSGAGVIPAANLPATGAWITIPPTAGNAYKYLRVNSAGTALEYVLPIYA